MTWTQSAEAVAPALAELEARLDLLVIATHGRGPLRQLVHSGVACDVAACARCPVVVVPAPLRDGEDEQRQHADGHEDDDGSGRQ